ncbi:hypothetical protein Moror_3616 [Moniliophthora roreri MCA 2997]|uniref:Uncharacterized protein n=1 Tax=Moniliophthora roreri (strain MCA 2997) TaxID=1381753 RepID=V2WX28_MONRO|nr:hypothetical protein Moror_3616 [Moniliophthora roreri MCA 2997]
MIPRQRSSVTRIITLQSKASSYPSFCDTSPVDRMSTQSLSEKAPRKDSKYTQGAFFLVLQVEAVEPPLRPATSFSSPLYPESTSSSQNIAPNVAHKGQ